MTPEESLRELQATFAAIEKVLRDEYTALTRLDAAGIAEATEKKLALDEKLRSFGGKLPSRPEVRRAIERLKSAAQMNQALLIHARTCLKGAFETLTGSPADTNSYARPLTSSAAVRINVRG
jgi:hypothetical protein